MRRRRRATAVGAAVAAAFVVMASVTACADGPRSVTLRIHHSAFDETQVSVPTGVPVTFVLVNEDPIDHEWLVGDDAFHRAHRSGTHASHGEVPTEVSVPALETVMTTITFDEPGTLTYICHLPQHEAYGMVGVLTVDG